MDLPGDLSCVKLPYDTKQPFRWPTKPSDVASEGALLAQKLVNVALECHDLRARNIYLVAFKWFLVEYVALIHTCLLLQRAEERGDRLRFSDLYPMFQGLQEQGVPYDGDGISPMSYKREPPTGWRSRNKLLRRLGRQVQWGGWKGLGIHNTKGSRTITVMSPAPLLVDAVRRSGAPVYYLMPEALLCQTGEQVWLELVIVLRALADRTQQVIQECLEGFGWKANARMKEYVFNLTLRMLTGIANDYIYIERLWRDHTPATLWTGTGGDYWVRIARALVQGAGGEVTGFDHGGPTSIFKIQDLYYLDGLFANRFVTHSDVGAQLYKRNAAYWPLGLPPLHIEGSDVTCSSMQALLKKESKVPVNRTIRKVMYVSTVYREDRQWPEAILMDDPVYLDWQARLIEMLADAGVEVLCKPHPYIPARGQFNGVPFEYSTRCRYLYEDLEDVWNEADALLFDYSSSTAFWHALCTRKPLIWVDHGQHPWHPEPYELIGRRYRIIPASFDSDNRMQVDRAALVEALRKPADEPDMTFVEQYILGGTSKSVNASIPDDAMNVAETVS